MRIALSTIGTLGDVIPFARLATRLLARGHDVTVHSWEQFASWFPTGARFEPTAASVGEAELATMLDEAIRAPSFTAQKQRFASTFYDDTRVREGYARARLVLEGHDLAVINVLDHVAQVAAIDVGVAWASYASRPPPNVTVADAQNAQLDDSLSALLARVTGVQRRIRMFREWSPRLAFAACAAELLTDELRDLIFATGAWLEPPKPGALPAAVEAFLAGGDCLFATFGTMPDVYARTASLVRAARDSGWRAIVQVLTPHDVNAPDNVLVLRDRVAFDVLVPRVTAVVHHGSVGTVHEIVRAGKPSLTIAHMGDQFFWGEMLHQKGLGPAQVPHVTINEAVLALRLTELRADRYARNAAALAPVIAAQDGVARAVERIEASA